MDQIRKKIFKEMEEVQQQTGRMLRNMSLARMMPFESYGNRPAVNLYESEREIHAYFDLAGADTNGLTVLAEENRIKVSGTRALPGQQVVACIHQLEIELGPFERTVSLPAPIEVDGVTSTLKNGILLVTMPKKQPKGKINIDISTESK